MLKYIFIVILTFILLQNYTLGQDIELIEKNFILNNASTADEVISQFGEPDEKSIEQYQGADGCYIQTWYYRSIGLEINFCRYEVDNIKHAGNINFYSPCELKTSKGIGIGSSKNDVIKAYKKDIKKNGKVSDTEISLGEECSGVIFSFENNLVISIFIGAFCE